MAKLRRDKENGDDKETKKALLNNSNHAEDSPNSKEEVKIKAKEAKEEKKKKAKSAWAGLFHKCRLLWPFMWPKGDFALQVRIIVCVIIVVATRGVTVLVPIYYKKIVNSLVGTPVAAPLADEKNETLLGNINYLDPSQDIGLGVTLETLGVTLDVTLPPTTPDTPPVILEPPNFCWDYILIFILLKSLHGGSGYLNCLRSFLWISVSQFTRKKMRLELFTHLHRLSVQWHLQRKTGEVLRVMDRGVNSINLILSHALFNIAPVIADVIIAIVFFVTVFDVWTGFIVFGTMVGYLVSTIVISEWRTKYRRQMNETDNARNATSVDSILNFETVKYYSAEEWEVKCYEQSVDLHLKAEWSVNATANLLNCIQRGMMMLGLLGGSLLLAWHVHTGRLTLGDFVLFLSYVEQLYGPLNMFGAYYRTLQQAFVDMENMFEMLEEKVEVKDLDNAPALKITSGEITFDNVHFSYNPKKAILRGINFTIPAGQTYALVGHSGGGKSTIIRLLFRFYDIQSGAIRIDGQDISKVTQKSLRQQVGVVPQDTVLFNKDIRYNIRYGRHDATDEEVEEAAKSSDIHDRIIGIPDGYNSKVGERGLKLSGGEKQRIAIARTILKAPQIVLLDEATSALDTKTERNIQESLSMVCEGKTTVIVAHRLSTIIHADQILVIEEGQIVEQGTHDELIMDEGLYCDMWHDQLQSGEIEDDLGEACSCCPDGIHQERTTDGEETEDEIEALVERELAEVDGTPQGNVAATPGKESGMGLGSDLPPTEENTEGEKLQFEEDRERDREGDADSLSASANRNSRVLFALDGSNKDLKIIEEGDDGYEDTSCKCPCHITQEVMDDLMSHNPSVFTRQISAQGTSLEDVGSEANSEPFGEAIGPDVLAPLSPSPMSPLLPSAAAVEKEQLPQPTRKELHDKGVQVKILPIDLEDEDYDDLFHIPQRLPLTASISSQRGARPRHIGRTISMSERPRPRYYDRPLSIYGQHHRLASSSDGRDRSRTVSTGEELAGSSTGARGLRRQLSRQQSCLHARCKAKEFRERQMSRDRDRDNANRLSVKDHEHFSVSIDDLNAATEQYFKDSEDNSALKTTIVTPTEEEEQKYPTVADVIKENNRHSIRNSMEVTVNIEDV